MLTLHARLYTSYNFRTPCERLLDIRGGLCLSIRHHSDALESHSLHIPAVLQTLIHATERHVI